MFDEHTVQPYYGEQDINSIEMFYLDYNDKNADRIGIAGSV
jgi:hypothetical protein